MKNEKKKFSEKNLEKKLEKKSEKTFKFLDALTASGLRALRVLKELP